MASPDPLRKLFPYRTTYISADLTAGLSVFLVSLPLCLGVALASGAPLLAGLVAGIIGGIVVGLLSGSEISVTGPAAGLAVIVAESIGTAGSYQAFLLVVVLAGLIQVLLGVFRVGWVSSFVPNSVVSGMLVGIGLVIVLKQIPLALGSDRLYMGDFEFGSLANGENTLSEIYRAIVSANSGALFISLVSLGVLILWRRQADKGIEFFRTLPSALVAVLIGVGLNQLFRVYMPDWYLGNSDAHMVNIPILSAENGLDSILIFPDFSRIGDLHIYALAATLVVVASLEALITIEAADRGDSLRRVSSTNKELIAQGVGNMLSGLLGGLPVTAVAVRTSTNIFSGGKSRMATMLQGFLLLGSLLFGAAIINSIPLACLAALLIVIGYRLASPSVFARIYREGWSQFIPFITTVLGIVFTNLLIGLTVGLVVGYIFVLYTNAQSSFRVIRDGNNVLIKFQKDMYFPNKAKLKETLRKLQPGDSVLVDGRYATFIDHDIYQLVTDFSQTARNLGISYELRDVTERKKTLTHTDHATVRKTITVQ